MDSGGLLSPDYAKTRFSARLLDGRQLKHHASVFWVTGWQASWEGKLKGLDFLVKVLRRGNFYLCTNGVKLSRHQMLENASLEIEKKEKAVEQEKTSI